MKKLYGKPYRHGVLQPKGNFVITIDNQKFLYSTPKEAEDALKIKLPQIFS